MTHTPGPWEWRVEDYSMASLLGPEEDFQHVLSVSPCKACQGRTEPKEWAWGRCMTPSSADADLIAAAPDLLAALYKLRNLAMNVESDLLFNGHVTELTSGSIAGAIKIASAAIEKADPLTPHQTEGAENG